MKLISFAPLSLLLSSPPKPSASVALVTHRAAVEMEIRMQQTELSNRFQYVVERSEKRVQAINYILAFLLIVVIVWALYAAWLSSKQEKITALTLVPGSVKVVSPTALCPGDTLRIAYALDVDGVGVIVTDDSVKSESRTVKFSQSRREYVDHTTRNIYEDTWTIPPAPEMEISGRQVWVPGNYTRFISIAASNAYVSRYTEPASFGISFTIKKDCPPVEDK